MCANIPTEIQVRSCRNGDAVVIAMLNSLTSKHNCWKGSGGGRVGDVLLSLAGSTVIASSRRPLPFDIISRIPLLPFFLSG